MPPPEGGARDPPAVAVGGAAGGAAAVPTNRGAPTGAAEARNRKKSAMSLEDALAVGAYTRPLLTLFHFSAQRPHFMWDTLGTCSI